METALFLFFFSAAPFGMWDPSSPTRDQTLEVQSLNYWTAREVPEIFFWTVSLLSLLCCLNGVWFAMDRWDRIWNILALPGGKLVIETARTKKLHIQVLLNHLSTCPIYGSWPLQGQQLQCWPSLGNSRRTNQLGPGSFKTSSFPGTFLKMASRQEMEDQETSSWWNTFGD